MFSFLKKSAPDTKAEAPGAPAPPSAAPPAAAPTWRERLFKGLAKTRAQLGGKLKNIFSRGKVDDELLEELETLLLTSDVGIEATTHLLNELKKAAKRCVDHLGDVFGAVDFSQAVYIYCPSAFLML